MRWPIRSLFVVAPIIAGFPVLADPPAEKTPPPASTPSPTTPAPSTPAQSVDHWANSIETLTKALAENDAAKLAAILGEGAAIQSLDGKSGDALRLLARVKGGVLLFSKAFQGLPPAAAVELAEAIKTTGIPDEVKQDLTPVDDLAAKRANATAAAWVSVALGARPNDPTAMLVFWCDTPGENAEGRPAELLFVLVKSEAGLDSRPRIKLVAFGDPRKPAR